MALEEVLTQLLISFTAGIACHYVCKWLDREKDSKGLEE